MREREEGGKETGRHREATLPRLDEMREEEPGLRGRKLQLALKGGSKRCRRQDSPFQLPYTHCKEEEDTMIPRLLFLS